MQTHLMIPLSALTHFPVNKMPSVE